MTPEERKEEAIQILDRMLERHSLRDIAANSRLSEETLRRVRRADCTVSKRTVSELHVARRAVRELEPSLPSSVKVSMRHIDAELYREWYEDQEWWAARYPDGCHEDGPELYDDKDNWLLSGMLELPNLGYIIPGDDREDVELSDDVEAWLEAKGRVPYRTVTVRVFEDNLDAFHAATVGLLYGLET